MRIPIAAALGLIFCLVISEPFRLLSWNFMKLGLALMSMFWWIYAVIGAFVLVAAFLPTWYSIKFWVKWLIYRITDHTK